MSICPVCAYEYIFQKRLGCALTGACALIRTNAVCILICQRESDCQDNCFNSSSCGNRSVLI